MTLRETIEVEIRERGPIPFSRYMELCLYHPELGYYSRAASNSAKPAISTPRVMCMPYSDACWPGSLSRCGELLGSPAQIEILELGPGRGLFAQDVLDWSEKKFPGFFAAVTYSLAEQSPVLRERLQTTLARHFENRKAALMPGSPSNSDQESADAASGRRYRGRVPPEVPLLVFANEFFDALPVDILGERGQLRIALDEGRLKETWAPASAQQLEFLDRYSVHPEAGERIEVPLIAQRWMSEISRSLQHGFLVVIDYGYTRAEQLAGRHRGTLAAFRQHSMSTNPYEAPGEQDLTSHVNFTSLSAAAEQEGVQVSPVITQSQFLLGIGEHNQFADAFEDCRLPQERAKVALQLKHLITPAGVGETFHVLAGSKGVSQSLLSQLSGLSFGQQR